MQTDMLPLDEPVAATTTTMPLARFLETKNLAYQLYTNTDRAIPLVTSGVKPGAQRLLYAMLREKVLPGTKPRKSAKLTAATTGAYHPHGQAAMYGTLATLAAPYGRINPVEGVGAFGQVPGDTPAADRYTEARLSPVGYSMVEEVDDGAVPMRPTYDGELQEPWYLPVQFPVLLAIGADGVGEGWATKTPAHNPREVVDAALYRLDNPDCTVDELMEIMPGPDWGTGGEIVGGTDGIRDYMATGRGKMTVRGTWTVEGRDITITEVPPGVSVPTLLNGSGKGTNPQPGLREKVRQKIITGVADVSDLSDLKHGLRIVVTCKRGVDTDDVIKQLLRETDLETTYAASVVALDTDLTPRWWSVPDLLDSFLQLRDGVVTRRSKHQLEKVRQRLNRAHAVATVTLDKEKTIRLITQAEDKAAAIAAIADGFDLDESQATYVVEMPLHRLTKADTLEAQKRVDTLTSEADRLCRLVESADARHDVIRDELAKARRLFDGDEFDRRTRINADAQPVTGTGEGLSDQQRLALWKLDTLRLCLGPDGDTPINEGESVYTAFRDGKFKRFDGAYLTKTIRDTPLAPDLDAVHSAGTYRPDKQYILLVTRGTTTASATRSAKVLKLDTSAMTPKGLTSHGVRGISLTEGDELVACLPATDEDALLTISDSGWKTTPVSDIPVKGTGTRGVGVHSLTSKDNGVTIAEVGSSFTVNDQEATPTPRGRAPHRQPVTGWTRGSA